jgi:hypothetical protein
MGLGRSGYGRFTVILSLTFSLSSMLCQNSVCIVMSEVLFDSSVHDGYIGSLLVHFYRK